APRVLCPLILLLFIRWPLAAACSESHGELIAVFLRPLVKTGVHTAHEQSAAEEVANPDHNPVDGNGTDSHRGRNRIGGKQGDDHHAEIGDDVLGRQTYEDRDNRLDDKELRDYFFG